MNIYRHGDLSFKQIDKLPEDVKEMKQEKSFVLALGEHTGHKHVITAEKEGVVQMLTTMDGKTVLVIEGVALLTHEEHKTITFAPGIYEMDNEQEYDNKCALCGTKENLTVDHVYPISRGGPNIIGNIIPLCRSCNSKKKDRILTQEYDWFVGGEIKHKMSKEVYALITKET